jgi:hypothetical protein
MKCAKEDCDNDAIKRGKYCILHRTTRRKTTTPTFTDEDKLNEELIAKMLEDDVWGGGGGGEGKEEKKEERREEGEEERERRLLVEQQNWEYMEAERQDIENLHRKQREVDRKIKIRQKFASYRPLPSDIILQFMFPEFCLKVRQSFHGNAALPDLYDFVDLTLEDNNITMPDYQMVVYPNIIYSRGRKDKLCDINITHGVSILIQRLE